MIELNVAKVVAGVQTNLAFISGSPMSSGVWYTIRLQVDANGRFWMWYYPAGSAPGSAVLSGQDSALATGGALASGKVGFCDMNGSATAATRNYDNFMAFVPTADAGCFATQSLEIRHDRAERENAAGTTWNKVSSRRGNYLRFAPGAAEGRSSRFFLKGVRGNEVQTNVWADPTIDDIARWTCSPLRWVWRYPSLRRGAVAEFLILIQDGAGWDLVQVVQADAAVDLRQLVKQGYREPGRYAVCRWDSRREFDLSPGPVDAADPV